MTATTANDECVLKWCNEAGDHDEHRQYVTSLAVEGSGSVLGVNLVEPEAGLPRVEMTVVPRYGPSLVVVLKPDEADVVGEALVEAAARRSHVPAG